MRKRACLSIMLAVATPAVAQSTRFDAVVAAPASHHILLEDDKVRMLRVEIAPGATEPEEAPGVDASNGDERLSGARTC